MSSPYHQASAFSEAKELEASVPLSHGFQTARIFPPPTYEDIMIPGHRTTQETAGVVVDFNDAHLHPQPSSLNLRLIPAPLRSMLHLLSPSAGALLLPPPATASRRDDEGPASALERIWRALRALLGVLLVVACGLALLVAFALLSLGLGLLVGHIGEQAVAAWADFTSGEPSAMCAPAQAALCRARAMAMAGLG